ncbi:FAD-binding oxidoreductase [Rheinheimera sp. MA13]|uniref:FAD-binding oxidoreductase n=2 Tax=Rheinheimera maricola TaxID=2793282 RepID=A0ABS7X744_9GAMM|nr:FAD-dependent oxidoreductase [Rheinheimera maricola]MBZ9610985.1 FAD-binding oxidoreductase [Rheinheimera maricola]
MYDPLVNNDIGCNATYPNSYWAQHVDTQPDTVTLQQDITTDVVVVGGGYTGLSCAYQLAQRFNREVTVLEANRAGWGCSGRNAGFVLRGTGRLSLAQLSQKFGLDIARVFHQEYSDAITQVRQMIAEGNINCDAQTPGYLKVAHKASLAADFPAQVEFLQRQFGYKAEYLSAAEVKSDYMHNTQAHGAIRFADCFGVNPLALAQGYAAMAQRSGARLYSGSPVTKWQRNTDGGFVLQTPQARVHCKQLVFATNGYTPKGFYPPLNRACLPVLSSIIVTSPLSEQQLQQSGLHHNQIVMDTRALKYYYRKLPDNRILFGGRSAVYGKDAEKAVYPARLLSALKNCFPMLDDLRCDYHWSGWVAVSYDDLPRVCEAESGLFYAGGYCGSGLSFSTLAGVRLAELTMGLALPDLPIYQGTLAPFPLPAFRRLGQQGYYQWGRFKDRFL